MYSWNCAKLCTLSGGIHSAIWHLGNTETWQGSLAVGGSVPFDQPGKRTRTCRADSDVLNCYEPALGVSVKSVHLVAGRLAFIPSRVILKTLKILFAAFAPGARHKRKCEGFCVCVVRHVMSLNSVQSFVIENCNGPTIENGLNNVCLHPLSRTFTFFYLLRQVYDYEN